MTGGISLTQGLDQLFAGRQAERAAIDSLFTQMCDEAAHFGVVYIRGMGGAGKTWLSQRAIDDAQDRESHTIALAVDCSSMTTPSLAGVARQLARAAGLSTNAAAAHLADLCDRIDRTAGNIRTTEAPPELTEAEATDWHAARAAALESLTFATSAAVESHLGGSDAATHTSNAILSGVRALSAGATAGALALSRLLRRLRDDGEVDAEDVELALNPQDGFTDAISALFEGLATNGPLIVWLDKAEALESIMFQLVQVFERAAEEAYALVIFSGRLTSIRTPRGDLLTPNEHLRSVTRLGADIELGPMTQSEVEELIQRHYAHRHDKNPPPIPKWVVNELTTATGGMPLWLSLVVQGIVKDKRESWDGLDVSPYDDPIDLRVLLRRIIGDASVGTSPGEADATYRLLVSLAIAPAGASDIMICEAADLPDTRRLSSLDGSFSFMNGRRLHDSVRSALRAHLAANVDDRELAQKIAANLRARSQFDLPSFWEQSPPTLNDVERAKSDLDLACWIDRVEGYRLAIAHGLIGFSRDAHWLADLLLAAAWHAIHDAESSEDRRALTHASRLCAAHLFAAQTTKKLSAESARSVFRYAASTGVNRRDSIVLIGRCLSELERYNATAPLPSYAALTLAAERVRWLSYHGFDDDVESMARGIADAFESVPWSSWLRQVAASAVCRVLHNRIRAFAHVPRDDIPTENRESAVGSFLAALQILPSVALPLLGSMSQFMGYDEARQIARRLATGFKAGDHERSYSLALAEACRELSLWNEALRMYSEALKVTPDLLIGWRGRAQSLWALGREDDALEAFRKGIQAATSLDIGILTDSATSAYADLVNEYFVLASSRGLRDIARDILERTPRSVRTPYTDFVVELLDGTVEHAAQALEACISEPEYAAYFCVELALLQIRSGSLSDAEQTLMGRTEAASLLDSKVEEALVKIAVADGWCPVEIATQVSREVRAIDSP